MLLSLRYRFLFVHTAKTGGTSIRAALNRYKWSDPYRIPMFFASKLSRLTGNQIGSKFPRHAKVIAAQEMLPREVFDSLYKFAFVRNPWDLQVSSYHHIRRERPHLLEGIETFGDFLQFKFDPQRPYQYHLDTSIERQSDYIIDLQGNVIVNFIGRYENLEIDFARVCEQIGIPCPALPHKREARDRADYQTYYDNELIELIARKFSTDIEMFGYEF